MVPGASGLPSGLVCDQRNDVCIDIMVDLYSVVTEQAMTKDRSFCYVYTALMQNDVVYQL